MLGTGAFAFALKQNVQNVLVTYMALLENSMTFVFILALATQEVVAICRQSGNRCICNDDAGATWDLSALEPYAPE